LVVARMVPALFVSETDAPATAFCNTSADTTRPQTTVWVELAALPQTPGPWLLPLFPPPPPPQPKRITEALIVIARSTLLVVHMGRRKALRVIYLPPEMVSTLCGGSHGSQRSTINLPLYSLITRLARGYKDTGE